MTQPVKPIRYEEQMSLDGGSVDLWFSHDEIEKLSVDCEWQLNKRAARKWNKDKGVNYRFWTKTLEELRAQFPELAK